MKKFTEILSGSAVMLFHVALTGWLFCLSKVNVEFEAMSLNYLALCAVLLPAYYLDLFMLRRGLPVPVFALAQIAFAAIGAWVFVQSAYLQPFKTGTVVMSCIIFCLGFVVADFVAWIPTNESGVLLRFDALTAMIIILLALDHILSLPAAGGAIAMCAVSLFAMLLSGVSMRSGRLAGRGTAVQGDPAVGKILLGVVLGLMALLAGLLVMFATSGMKSFFGFALELGRKCLRAVGAALLWLYGLLERFMLWLSQFASNEPMGAVNAPQSGPVIEPDLSGGELSAVPDWLYPALIALAAAAVVFAIFRLRHVRVGKQRFHTGVVRVQTRSSGLKAALGELLLRLKNLVLFRWRCLRFRKTAPGLLLWCEGRVEKSLRRLPGESGESFLRRLSRLGYSPELSAALESLAELVERSFYSPVPVTVPAEVCKSLRRGKFKTEKTDVN